MHLRNTYISGNVDATKLEADALFRLDKLKEVTVIHYHPYLEPCTDKCHTVTAKEEEDGS